MQTGLVIINENGGGYMHIIYQTKPLIDFTSSNYVINLGCDIDKGRSFRDNKNKIFCLEFQFNSIWRTARSRR
jgi:hypothetical protein